MKATGEATGCTRAYPPTALARDQLISEIADLIDPAGTPAHSYATRAVQVRDLLRSLGIHPGQRDQIGLPVLPPHDDCRECEGGA